MTLKEMIKWQLDKNRDKFLSKRKLIPSDTPIGLSDRAKKFVVKGKNLIDCEGEWKSKINTRRKI